MDMDYMNVVMQGGAIPGSSLVTDPDDPAPYEKPPEYTDIHAASEWIFSDYTSNSFCRFYTRKVGCKSYDSFN